MSNRCVPTRRAYAPFRSICEVSGTRGNNFCRLLHSAQIPLWLLFASIINVRSRKSAVIDYDLLSPDLNRDLSGKEGVRGQPRSGGDSTSVSGHGYLSVCVGCLFLRTPSRAPYRTPPACAKRAAYPDPPPVVPHPEVTVAAVHSAVSPGVCTLWDVILYNVSRCQ